MVAVHDLSLQNTPYQPGDPSFEFIIRPYEDKRVTFESRKFAKCFLSVNQSATVSVQELPPSSSEIQFVVRVQVSVHLLKISCIGADCCIVNYVLVLAIALWITKTMALLYMVLPLYLDASIKLQYILYTCSGSTDHTRPKSWAPLEDLLSL